MSRDKKKKNRFLLGAGVGAALVMIAIYWRCSSGGMGLGPSQASLTMSSAGSGGSSSKTKTSEATPPCELRLDSEGIKLDKQFIKIALAVAACKRSGRANIYITGGANVGKREALMKALKDKNIKVFVTQKQGSSAPPKAGQDAGQRSPPKPGKN